MQLDFARVVTHLSFVIMILRVILLENHPFEYCVYHDNIEVEYDIKTS